MEGWREEGREGEGGGGRHVFMLFVTGKGQATGFP